MKEEKSHRAFKELRASNGAIVNKLDFRSTASLRQQESQSFAGLGH